MAAKMVTIGAVVINVVDYEREKAFWTELLEVDMAREFPGIFGWLRPQHEGGISLALQKTDELKTDRNRVHIDTGVDDLDAAAARVEELGGSLVEGHEIMNFRWKIMADPEGNEFCIAKED